MTTVSYRFSGPTTQRRRVGKCPGCGKRVTRSCTFEHTVNPFNRHPTEDRPKTWEEVAVDVRAKADAWQPDFTCQACDTAADLRKATVTQLISWIHSESHTRYDHYREGKPSRAVLCNQRMAQYAARIAELEPGRVQWPTGCRYDRMTRSLVYCCYYEFPDQQRCVYGERHGAGYHLSPTGQRVAVAGGEVEQPGDRGM
jgi:hypothetical protein